ncbi:MAG: RNA polymerase sigma factor [Armatimonadetes bacterium]|nr:RNA polymerase sigma factor [Armatimonadota bacterium]
MVTDATELVRRAQQGDGSAFEELARHYRAALLAFAFSRTGQREEAEDLVQEMLAAAWEKLPQLREPAHFGAWLRSIARNACRGWYRRSRPWPASLDEASDAAQVPDPAPGPVEIILAREQQRAWHRALQSLPEANRLALLMHVWGDYSYEEIATILGVPVTTIEGRIHRAKAQLRRLLRADAGDLVPEHRRWWKEKR